MRIAGLHAIRLVIAITLGGACDPGDPAEIEAEFAITLPPNFSDSLVAAVGSPTALAFTPDGRLLVTTQGGVVRVISGGTLLPTPAIDLSARLCTNSERGLLGVTVDPSFATNQFIYVYYTFNKFNSCATNSSTSPVNRMSRLTLPSSNVIAPSSEVVLLDNIPSPNGNHNAGDLHFGPDGNLYISVGDGGCKLGDATRCAGQNDNARFLSILSGKILRLRPDGSIPSDNPIVGTAGARRCGNPAGVPPGSGPCLEMYAWGLRNPFRFNFRPGSTEAFVNDTGQDAWEEIDRLARNADYGWNQREGHCANGSTTNCGAPPAGMTNPVFDYKHGSNPAPSPFQGCNAITGGAFIPSSWPAPYGGNYFFSDFVCGQIFLLSGTSASSFATALGGSSAVDLVFGPGPSEQALYYTTYAGGGQVRRIDVTGTANRAPTARLTATPTSGPAPLAVSFNGSGSTDPDPGDTLTYVFNFGDGSAPVTTASSTQSHSYATGTFTASLTVRDNHGLASAPVTVRIDAGNTAPVPVIDQPTATQVFAVGQQVTLVGHATDAQDGTLADTRLSWVVILHHNTHTHPFLAATTGNRIVITTPAPEDLAATATSFLEIRLTATDSRGLAATVVRNFQPHKVNVTLASAPSGLVLGVNGTTVTTPATLVSWEHYALNVSAAAQFDGSGQGWRFSSWSDGGAAAHTIVTPAANATYTATFRTAFAAKVNFQMATSATPAGYRADSGLVFGDRGNGLRYGWNVDNSAQARDRNAANSPDQRYDTLNHLQKPANPNAFWDIEVPSGSYRVRIVTGDPSFIDSVYQLRAEATVVVQGTPTASQHWFDATATVSVSDGRLTVSNGAQARNNKICFIEILQQ